MDHLPSASVMSSILGPWLRKSCRKHNQPRSLGQTSLLIYSIVQKRRNSTPVRVAYLGAVSRTLNLAHQTPNIVTNDVVAHTSKSTIFYIPRQRTSATVEIFSGIMIDYPSTHSQESSVPLAVVAVDRIYKCQTQQSCRGSPRSLS